MPAYLADTNNASPCSSENPRISFRFGLAAPNTDNSNRQPTADAQAFSCFVVAVPTGMTVSGGVRLSHAINDPAISKLGRYMSRTLPRETGTSKTKSFQSPKILLNSSFTVSTGVLERLPTNSSNISAAQKNGVAAKSATPYLFFPSSQPPN